MSVTGSSYNINAISKLSEQELKKGIFKPEESWHNSYKDSCYVFVGGLVEGLTEGDVAIVFSQWGEIVDIHLVRDKRTGKSRGYGFVGYEDQRSTILAVDNFNGSVLLGRRLRVDHCKGFRAPRVEDSEEDDQTDGKKEYQPTGAEGKGQFGAEYRDSNASREHSRGFDSRRSPQRHSFNDRYHKSDRPSRGTYDRDDGEERFCRSYERDREGDYKRTY